MPQKTHSTVNPFRPHSDDPYIYNETFNEEYRGLDRLDPRVRDETPQIWQDEVQSLDGRLDVR
ncbi:hypothetical protein HK104_001108, partial [Borealophlyctis nickersoniae]